MKLHEYQIQVGDLILRCFGREIANDQKERGFRFGEEALELIQALDVTKEEALQLVDYVYSRPKGEAYQEVGGVMVTLASMCQAQGLSLEYCALAELARIKDPAIMDKIRAKQATKPQRSPLPGLGLNAPTKEGGEEWKEYTGVKRRHSDPPMNFSDDEVPHSGRSAYDLTPSPKEPGAHTAWQKDNLDPPHG